MDTSFVSELARQLAARVPPGVGAAADDLEKNFAAALQSALGRLDLVTREEFDVQRRVLERTREKLAEVEKQLAEHEASRQSQ